MNNDIDLQTPDKAKIEEIIKIEWQMFQNVDNLGGRADCQDDFETFYIMRRSQYDNWTEEMVRVYGDFAAKSLKEGRNLISEKYARMMAYTDLHYFNKHLRDKLPAVPAKNFRLINKIVERLICWEEEMARRYPKLAGTARPIRSSEDKYGFTSMETYARGELETYPEELLALYCQYVDDLWDEGISLSRKNLQTMVSMYGYDSIEEAEGAI
ncbi:MAG: DUF4125 family protein [Firmicutes bacterium]|nr:DUF4125 family protein [Bacillota bacterium]